MNECCCNNIFDLEIEEDIFDLEIDSQEYDLEIDEIVEVINLEGDIFDGSYIYTPKFIQQIIETRNKTLKDNITLEAIEVARVSNTSGGKTVYIGGIFNG
jgi:hypothetical protein